MRYITQNLTFVTSILSMIVEKGVSEICSNLTIETPEWRYWPSSGVVIVIFEHLAPFSSVTIILFEHEFVYWLVQLCKYMFKVINGNTRTRCEPYLKLTMKTPGRLLFHIEASLLIYWANQWTGFYMIGGAVLVSLLLILNVFHTLLPLSP